MIHAYNEYYLSITQHKLAEMFEIAFYFHNKNVDEFAEMFMESPIGRGFETGDPVVVCGHSSNEMIGMIFDQPPQDYDQPSSASPEYWLGWVLSYAQWYFNKPFKTLVSSLPCSKLLENYFPYHEMDITQVLDLIDGYLGSVSSLRKMREKRNLSQSQLAILSDVPLRSIKAYEQGTVDISKAQAGTLYALAKVLSCTIEDLIL